MAPAGDVSADLAGAEIVTIGAELLLGDVADGNADWLSRRLAEVGVNVIRRTTVGDDDEAIRSAIGDGARRASLVVCTGGLGPTEDDRTRPAVASLFDLPLERRTDLMRAIEARLAAYGVAMTSGNARQADVPRGARVLPNHGGTAPGLIIETAACAIVLLPGVPREMKALFETQVEPYIEQRGLCGAPVRSRTLRTTGIAESTLANLLTGMEVMVEPLSLAYLPGADGVDLRLTSRALAEAEATDRLDRAEAAIRERTGRWIYGRDDADLAAAVGGRLRDRGWTVAVAESCTGGWLGKRLTDAPGASDYFVSGFVTYADAAKTRMLRVPAELIRRYGAVSGPVAARMARGARRASRADVALSITGIAGPGGGSLAKPVGMTWIGLSMRGFTRARRLLLPGDRAEIRARATQAALRWVWSRLDEPREANA